VRREREGKRPTDLGRGRDKREREGGDSGWGREQRLRKKQMVGKRQRMVKGTEGGEGKKILFNILRSNTESFRLIQAFFKCGF
jgi:hypothetical protein